MIHIILIEPETDGNIGAIARVMKNFGLKDLVLVNPKTDHLAKPAFDRACNAKEVLKNAKVKKKINALEKYDYVIGTTGKLGKDYNIPRVPIMPDEFANIVDRKKKIALVFGRESKGLTNEEIRMCDFTVTIPTSAKYPILNISHACGILCYELFKHSRQKKIGKNYTSIGRIDKKQILKIIDQKLEIMNFSTDAKRETQRRVWKKMISKSFLTKREAFALMGFLKKIK